MEYKTMSGLQIRGVIARAWVGLPWEKEALRQPSMTAPPTPPAALTVVEPERGQP